MEIACDILIFVLSIFTILTYFYSFFTYLFYNVFSIFSKSQRFKDKIETEYFSRM